MYIFRSGNEYHSSWNFLFGVTIRQDIGTKITVTLNNEIPFIYFPYCKCGPDCDMMPPIKIIALSLCFQPYGSGVIINGNCNISFYSLRIIKFVISLTVSTSAHRLYIKYLMWCYFLHKVGCKMQINLPLSSNE